MSYIPPLKAMDLKSRFRVKIMQARKAESTRMVFLIQFGSCAGEANNFFVSSKKSDFTQTGTLEKIFMCSVGKVKGKFKIGSG